MAKRKLGIRSLIFDDYEVIQLLRAAIERVGSQDAFARRHGIDRTHLNQILSGKKSVNTAVMRASRLVCRESSILRGDGGRFTTLPPSRLEARSRLGF